MVEAESGGSVTLVVMDAKELGISNTKDGNGVVLDGAGVDAGASWAAVLGTGGGGGTLAGWLGGTDVVPGAGGGAAGVPAGWFDAGAPGQVKPQGQVEQLSSGVLAPAVLSGPWAFEVVRIALTVPGGVSVGMAPRASEGVMVVSGCPVTFVARVWL